MKREKNIANKVGDTNARARKLAQAQVTTGFN
jgi:hypothetical protein